MSEVLENKPDAKSIQADIEQIRAQCVDVLDRLKAIQDAGEDPRLSVICAIEHLNFARVTAGRL